MHLKSDRLLGAGSGWRSAGGGACTVGRITTSTSSKGRNSRLRTFSLSSRSTARRRSDEGQGQSTRPARAMGWCGAREQQGEERTSHLLAALSMLLDQARPAQRTSQRGTRGQRNSTFVRAPQGTRTSLGQHPSQACGRPCRGGLLRPMASESRAAARAASRWRTLNRGSRAANRADGRWLSWH